MSECIKMNCFESECHLYINPSKTIFWVGAGVGNDEPCKLPLGNELTDVYLNKMLGEEYSRKFILYWNNYIAPLRSAISSGEIKGVSGDDKLFSDDDIISKSLGDRPRLEYIIGEFCKLDNEFSEFLFRKPENNTKFNREKSIEALRCFAKAEFNSNHQRLAECAKSGSIIVTTNFDVCIEKALGLDENIYNNPSSIEGVKLVRYGEKDCECIYHIHGIATDENIHDNLGVTIKNISRPLPKRFCEKIKKYLKCGYDIVFVGYSGQDYFDVRPFFEKMSMDSHYRGRAIYINHCNTAVTAKKCEDSVKPYNYLLQPFYEKVIVYGDTSFILEQACKDIGWHQYSKGDTDSKGKAFEATKDALDRIVNKYDEESKKDFYFLNLFRLSSQLNINMGHFEVEWGNIISRIYNMWKSDGEDTIKRMFEIDGQLNDVIIDDIRYNNWDSKNEAYVSIAHDANSYFETWNNRHTTEISYHMDCNRKPVRIFMLKKYVYKTCKILKEGVKNAKDEAVERDTMMYFYSKQIKKLFDLWDQNVKLRWYYNCKMILLLPYYNRLLSYHFSSFMYRTYYLFPCRFRNLIYARIKRVKKGSENKLFGNIQHEWDICMESSNLFDARSTISNRIDQIEVLKMRGFKIDDEISNQLKDILNMLYKIRADV